VEEIPLDRLADEHGTPLYVYSGPAIRERVQAARTAFAAHETLICYSVKANSALHLLRFMNDFELGFDIVSGGELHRLGAVGISTDRTVFAGSGKGRDELEMAIRCGVWLITIESTGEAELLAEVATDVGARQIEVALRLNVDVDAGSHPHITTARRRDKFGIDLDKLPDLLRLLKKSPLIRPICLHMHLGSQISDVEPYRKGIQRLVEAAAEVEEAGYAVRWLNAGGGFGIALQGEMVPGFGDYAEAILPLIAESGRGLILEPGRSLVGAAGCLVTEVLYRKQQGDRTILIVDAGLNDFLRPALYGASHRIEPVGESRGRRQTVDIAGPICESTDVFGVECDLPAIGPGARLAILDTGAYGMSMSGNYNSRCRPAEVWASGGGRIELIRRRETHDDLILIEREGLV